MAIHVCKEYYHAEKTFVMVTTEFTYTQTDEFGHAGLACELTMIHEWCATKEEARALAFNLNLIHQDK